jgi:hypothetical protein
VADAREISTDERANIHASWHGNVGAKILSTIICNSFVMIERHSVKRGEHSAVELTGRRIMQHIFVKSVLAGIAKLRLVVFVLFGWAAASVAQAEVSGVYIDASPNLVEMVQIVKMPDGRIAGRIESVTLDEQGKLKTLDFTIEGAADGNQIALYARSILFNGDISLSGFVDGDLLDLSGSGEHRTYQRASTYDYQAAITGLQARSIQILSKLSADRARSEFSALVELSNSLQRRFPDIQRQIIDSRERYKKLYKRLRNRRNLSNMFWSTGGSSALARNAEQESYRAEKEIWRLDTEIRNLKRALELDFDKADSLTASMQTYCVENEDTALKNVCSELKIKEGVLRALSDKLVVEFDTLAETVERYR